MKTLVRQKEHPNANKEHKFLKAQAAVKEKELAALRKEMETQTKELEVLRNQALILQADFENAKKRWIKNQAQLQERANADILREFLEILDDFERAVGSQTEDPKNFRLGVELIHKRLAEFLKAYGISPMGAAGQPFDASRHEAVAHEATDAVAESTVLEELRKGYLINGQVLRTAVVKVAVKEEGPKPETSHQIPEEKKVEGQGPPQGVDS